MEGQARMKRPRLLKALALTAIALGIAGCGLRGRLDRPPPLWGNPPNEGPLDPRTIAAQNAQKDLDKATRKKADQEARAAAAAAEQKKRESAGTKTSTTTSGTASGEAGSSSGGPAPPLPAPGGQTDPSTQGQGAGGATPTPPQ